ncbi:hypothetical protein [Ectobacillus sp. sgz5001026]|uniref:hypothetical protein n=1 Tax=Ectobacillus sp. sgz5001026 TaxID=3242473 RepID=UPI0036D3287B
MAINVDPRSPAAFVYSSEIVKSYHCLGEYSKAIEEMDKLQHFIQTQQKYQYENIT